MCNKHVNKDDVIVDGKKIKEVDRYIYLGHMVTMDYDQEQEMKKENRTGMECIRQVGQHHSRPKMCQ